MQPTPGPTLQPTPEPSLEPSMQPTARPTATPTAVPSRSLPPSSQPTGFPNPLPTQEPQSDDSQTFLEETLSLSSPAGFAALGVGVVVFFCISFGLYRAFCRPKKDTQDAQRMLQALDRHEVQMTTASPLQSFEDGYTDESIKF